jgi:hypothetical protein
MTSDFHLPLLDLRDSIGSSSLNSLTKNKTVNCIVFLLCGVAWCGLVWSGLMWSGVACLVWFRAKCGDGVHPNLTLTLKPY